MYQFFIGIDIGKYQVAVAVYGQDRTTAFENTPKGHRALYRYHKSFLRQGLVVVETTGGYEQAFIAYLQAKGVAVHRAHAQQVKYFIRALGMQGKSDAMDAKALSRYGYERHAHLPLYQAADPTVKRLWELAQRRQDLKKMLVQEKNRCQGPGQESLQKSFRVIIQALSKEIDKIETQMKEVVQRQPFLATQKTVLESIPGVGEITSLLLLANLPELGRCNRRQIASLAGLAPHPYESGQKQGYRATRGGRQAIKPILFMAAMSAVRSHSRLKAFYERLLQAGKKKMVALTALMRKIVVIANAKIKELLLQNNQPLQHS